MSLPVSQKKNIQEPQQKRSAGLTKIENKTCEIHGTYKAKVAHIGFAGKEIYTMCPICEKEHKEEQKNMSLSKNKKNLMG